MTNSEFVEATSQLERFFEKELEEYQLKIWYEELKNIDIKRYSQIIREVYKKCKFMPKLADITNINSELPYQKQKTTEYVEKCEKCQGKGFILYKKRIEDKEYDFFARCNCGNGNIYQFNGKETKDSRNKSNYYIPTLNQINLKEE